MVTQQILFEKKRKTKNSVDFKLSTENVNMLKTIKEKPHKTPSATPTRTPTPKQKPKEMTNRSNMLKSAQPSLEPRKNFTRNKTFVAHSVDSKIFQKHM